MLLSAFLLIQLTALAVGLFTMHRAASGLLMAETREQVTTEVDALRGNYEAGGMPMLRRAIAERLRIRDAEEFVILVREQGKAPWGGGMTRWPDGVPRSTGWMIVPDTRPGHPADARIGLAVTQLSPRVDLLVGDSLVEEARLRRASEAAIFTAVGVGSLVAIIFALLMLRLLGRRIDEFTEVAEAVQGGDLDRRWLRSDAGDSFDRLGSAINAMLDRVERLVGELRMVTDSVAHDLRSPVMRLKTNLEQAMGTVRDPAAAEALASAIEESDSLHRMLDAALDISRAEAGIGRDQFSRFSMAELLFDIADVFGPLAEDRGIAISVETEEPLLVTGHRELLQRAISNLVENAIKHAVGGKAITVRAAALDRAVTLSVEDDGPGIPQHLREDALKRFSRLDRARTTSGAGLGLSLVKTIATMHEGDLLLTSGAAGGLIVTLRLPIAA